jgi:hypothetical protein
MNPDGYEAGSRFNAGYRDLNRDFPVWPDGFDGTVFDGGDLNAAGREPETRHVMTWSARESFTLAANLHTGALVVNYPYDDDGKGSVDSPSPDDALFEYISRFYSMNNPTMWSQSPFPDGIVNGAEWYYLPGGMQDWNYRYLGCNAVTLELSETKAPAAASLPGHWEDNREAMLAYAETAHIGARGVVTDRDTGLPLWARVRVDGNAQAVFTDADAGDFHRMLLPGAYTLRIDSPGYAPVARTGVLVTDGPATRVDAELVYVDLDGDGAVTVADAQIVVNAALGLDGPPEADVDGGGVRASDVQFLVSAVLNTP